MSESEGRCVWEGAGSRALWRNAFGWIRFYACCARFDLHVFAALFPFLSVAPLCIIAVCNGRAVAAVHVGARLAGCRDGAGAGRKGQFGGRLVGLRRGAHQVLSKKTARPLQKKDKSNIKDPRRERARDTRVWVWVWDWMDGLDGGDDWWWK